MTIPIWLPFGLLALWCAIYPVPAWMRRLAGWDWYVIRAWTLGVCFSLAVWAAVWVLVLWLAGVL